MDTAFQLAAVHGTLYTGGNIVFAPVRAEKTTTTGTTGGALVQPPSEGTTSQEAGVVGTPWEDTTITNNDTDDQQLHDATAAATTTVGTGTGLAQCVLVTPVGNKLTTIDAVHTRIRTHVCNNSETQCFDLNSDGELAMVVGTRGLGVLYSTAANVALDTISFPPNCTIHAVKFSPCSRFVAVGLETTLQIYAIPSSRRITYQQCHRIENLHNIVNGQISSIEWSLDSTLLIIGSEDARVKIVARDTRHRKGLAQMHNNLIGHRGGIVVAGFTDRASCKGAVSVSVDNCVIIWERSDDVTRKDLMQIIAKNKFMGKVKKIEAANKRNNKKGGAKKKKQRGEGGEDDDEEDEDEGWFEEEEEAPSDEEKFGETFLEKEKRKSWAEQGLRLSAADDTHLPPALRFAYDAKRKILLQHKGRVSCAQFHEKRGLVAIGYDTGLFALHAFNNSAATATTTTASEDVAAKSPADVLPLLHLLSVSSQALTACAISFYGDYIALASEHLKQLLIWDWRSESFVLKEQSHYYDIGVTAMTPDGGSLITGGDDGKVKIWKMSTGQCYVTFTDHQASVTAVTTSHATNAFFTGSKDGTVRAFDLTRHRCFRVFHPQQPTQFSSVAVDPSGELIVGASSQDGTISVWAVQTGKLVDELSGHELAVSSILFHPDGTVLVSGGLDKNIFVWDMFRSGNEAERLKGEGTAITFSDEILSLSYSHDGRRLAVLTYNSEITIYDASQPKEMTHLTTFNTKFDAIGGWTSSSGPKSINSAAHFTSIAFSPLGNALVCCGDSKHICLYNSTQGYLIKQFPVTTNLDFEGAEEQYQWRLQTEAGPIDEIDVSAPDQELLKRRALEMPGARHTHFATGKRKTKITARSMHVSFASHGREFAVATTDGVQIYSLDVAPPKFCPVQLSEDLTTGNVETQLDQGNYDLAVIGSLLLEDNDLLVKALRATPQGHIHNIIIAVPTEVFPRLIRAVALEVRDSLSIEHSLLWAKNLLLHATEPLYGPMRDVEVTPALKLLHRCIKERTGGLCQLLEDNRNMLRFVIEQARMKQRMEAAAASGE